MRHNINVTIGQNNNVLHIKLKNSKINILKQI